MALKRTADSEMNTELHKKQKFTQHYHDLIEMDLSKEEIEMLRHLIKIKVRESYVKGEWVSWNSIRDNTQHIGQIIKVNPKTIKVQELNGTMWSMAGVILTRVPKPSAQEIQASEPKCTICKQSVARFGASCKVCPECAAKNATFITL